MLIDFQDQTQQLDEEEINLLNRLLRFAAKKENIPTDAEISVSIVNNQEIQEINRDYRQKDAPTDVISFAMQETVEGEMEILGEDIPLMLGDIIISIDKVKEQAEEYNHSFQRELGFLAVHGYDHMNVEDEKKMFSRQDEILGEFGLER